MEKTEEQLRQERVEKECYDIYEQFGYSSVFDHVAEQQRTSNPDYMGIVEEHCDACDNDMPALNHVCLICGQTTKPHFFEVVSTGFVQELQREQIEINAGENGKVLLIKTGEGFTVDVYNGENLIDTMTVWNDEVMKEGEDNE